MMRYTLMTGFYLEHGGDHVALESRKKGGFGCFSVRPRQFSELLGKKVRIVAEVIE